ncbi:MAG TPA: hypothetical protein VMR18_03895 [Candidatus Saccharimonadales bacterium]|nr:hypothetical protein [Candidatus Saccharimonadales bacterium]
MQTPGSQFLHERNPNLHSSQEVEGVVGYLRAGGESIPNEPSDKISAYLGFLANGEYVNDGILTGDQSSIDRQIDAHVIKAGDVPEGYFELQRRIAREQGHGDVTITRELREQMVEAVQADQRVGLGKWVEYLGGEDGGYPNWFKNYTFGSVTKLGSYDKEKGEFLKRSKGTTAPYPELNREALAYVYDVLNKSRVQGEKVNGGANDEQLQKLLKSGNFGALYAHAVLEVTPSSPELRKEVRGSWTKFNQTSDPRTARRLAGSLQGHGTGWCTAGESTATTQLSAGDFYVYYTRDEDGKETIPRVAIRMQGEEVAEVRGINTAQELEPEMADITSERLQDLPGGEEYIRKAQDMKFLTAIDKKISTDPGVKLTGDELRFLYELDHDILGFGYERDPRIDEIRAKREGRDKPELARILPETIRDQLKGAFVAYRTVADQLKSKRRFRGSESALSSAELEHLFALKDKEWQETGVYDHLVEELIANGARFNLVATPNIEATEKQIVDLAEAFGKQQPYSTYVYDELYRKGRYSSKEFSGNVGDAPVRLSLIPSRRDASLSGKTVETQVRMLREQQDSKPNLSLHVPSVLDAVTYWYTLRAQGDKLADSSAFDKTYIRHFDLDPKAVGRWSIVPDSYVYRAGRPYLHDSNVDAGRDARVAVG